MEDLEMAKKCLQSLEKSTYKTVVIYNQGVLSNEQVNKFLSNFDIEFILIGDKANTGTVVGRQSCFEYIWKHKPETEFISELHLDMIFTHNWENPLVDYLDAFDEPIVSCGIVDKNGIMSFINKNAAPVPNEIAAMDDYLADLRQELVVHGFTNPCIHKSNILKETGGYNASFLTGKQAFEDDSMLLGYYYYYGTKANWKPKVSYNSVVYHTVAGQRWGMSASDTINYEGLVKQYGATGLKHLAKLHKSQWQIDFFTQQYNSMEL